MKSYQELLLWGLVIGFYVAFFAYNTPEGYKKDLEKAIEKIREQLKGIGFVRVSTPIHPRTDKSDVHQIASLVDMGRGDEGKYECDVFIDYAGWSCRLTVVTESWQLERITKAVKKARFPVDVRAPLLVN
jgi:hypothetical protein